MEQDFDFENNLPPSMDDLTCWWSFKENMSEDINLAIGFFDRFAGIEPNWLMPTLFRAWATNRSSDTCSQRGFDAKLSAD